MACCHSTVPGAVRSHSVSTAHVISTAGVVDAWDQPSVAAGSDYRTC